MKKKEKKTSSKKKVEISNEPRIWYEKRKDGTRTGRTFAVIRDAKFLAVGISRCSRSDPFCKKIGRSIAVGRAQAVADSFINGRKEGQTSMTRSAVEVMDFAIDREQLLYPRSLPIKIQARIQRLPEWIFEDRRHK